MILMQTLPVSKRAAILKCLIEGVSIRATSRITGAAKTRSLIFSKRLGRRARRISPG